MGADSGAVWVLVELQEGIVQEVTLEMLGEARRVADLVNLSVWAVVIGRELADDEVSRLTAYGADQILLVEGSEADNPQTYTVEIQLEILTDLCTWGRPWMLAVAATSTGNETAACLAGRLGVGLVTQCTDLRPCDGELEAARMAYDDQVTITFSLKRQPYLITIRPGTLGVGSPSSSKKTQLRRVKIQEGGKTSPENNAAEEILVIQGTASVVSRIIAEEILEADPETIDLAEAEVIVTAGRGVQGGDGLLAVKDFATALGAPLGVTRALLDLGVVGEEKLIGQSGKTVKPRLYIAAGVSGASQHMTAVKGSVKIVAINTDRTAPILKQAELGVVGKLEEILPIVTARIREQEKRRENNHGN